MRLGALAAVDPDSPRAHELLAWSLMQQEKWREAIASVTRLIAIRPGDGKAYHNRAGCYARLGDRKAALEDVRIACQLGYQDGCRMLHRLE